jgi:hypothetical protein
MASLARIGIHPNACNPWRGSYVAILWLPATPALAAKALCGRR